MNRAAVDSIVTAVLDDDTDPERIERRRVESELNTRLDAVVANARRSVWR